MRATLNTPITLSGIGLHSGASVRLRLHPYDRGMWVISAGRKMEAAWHNVRPSRLCTLLASPEDPTFTLSTVEHLMSALSAKGITDVLIEIDGPEVPILDGSSAEFLAAIRAAGRQALAGARRRLVITSPVSYTDGNAMARLVPSETFSVAFGIDFANPAIGRQARVFTPKTDDYARDIAASRTFCMDADVRAMRASGLALGGGMHNAVVFGDHGVMNPEGLRFADEPVRHKILDALGDLHLGGVEIVGRFEGIRSGHLMTNMLLRAAFAQESQLRVRPAAQAAELAFA